MSQYLSDSERKKIDFELHHALCVCGHPRNMHSRYVNGKFVGCQYIDPKDAENSTKTCSCEHFQQDTFVRGPISDSEKMDDKISPLFAKLAKMSDEQLHLLYNKAAEYDPKLTIAEEAITIGKYLECIRVELAFRGIEFTPTNFDRLSLERREQKMSHNPNDVALVMDITGKCHNCQHHTSGRLVAYYSGEILIRCGNCKTANQFTPDDANYTDPKKFAPFLGDEDDRKLGIQYDLFTVEKRARGTDLWRSIESFRHFEDAKAWCLYNDNLNDGRIVDSNGFVVWWDLRPK